MSALAFRNNGITIAGKIVDNSHMWEESFPFGNFTIDTLYTYFFVSIGLLYFILIAISFFILSNKGNYLIAICILTFSCYATIELRILYPTTCFVLIFLSEFIRKRKLQMFTASLGNFKNN